MQIGPVYCAVDSPVTILPYFQYNFGEQSVALFAFFLLLAVLFPVLLVGLLGLIGALFFLAVLILVFHGSFLPSFMRFPAAYSIPESRSSIAGNDRKIPIYRTVGAIVRNNVKWKM